VSRDALFEGLDQDSSPAGSGSDDAEKAPFGAASGRSRGHEHKATWSRTNGNVHKLSKDAYLEIMEDEARRIATHIIGTPRALPTDAPSHTILAYDRRMTLHAPPDTGCGHAHGVSRYIYMSIYLSIYLSINICICVCVCIYMCIYVCVCVCVCVCVFIGATSTAIQSVRIV
jgi:hypothetical protein